MQKNSQWPCFLCPIPQFRLVGVRIFYILIFLGHLSSGPHYKPLFAEGLTVPRYIFSVSLM